MTTYYIDEGSFELSGLAFTDHTVHVFEAQHAEHGEVSLVVHRAEFPLGKSLRELVRAHVAREIEHYQGYVALDEREVTVAGAAALLVTSRYREGREIRYQSQTHLALGESWMYFALSAPCAIPAGCDAWMEQILASVRPRGDEQT